MVYCSARKLFLFNFFIVLLGLISISETIPTSEISEDPDDIDALYHSEDDVISLKTKTFNETVGQKPYAWFIEFYNRWCGYCQRYAPIYKKFATEIKNWDDLIKVGAVDCTNRESIELCYKYRINFYPTLRYFHEDFEVDSNETGINIMKVNDVYGQRRFLVRQMIEEQNNASRGEMYPNLQPYLESDSTNLFKKFDEFNYIINVIEEGDKLLGPILALDLHQFKEGSVNYLLNDNNTDLLEELGIIENNSTTLLIYKKENGTEPIFNESNAFDRKSLLETVINFFEENESISISIPNIDGIYTGRTTTSNSLIKETTPTSSNSYVLERIKNIGDVVFQEDLETALRFSLRREVLRQRLISEEKLDSLLAYLKVIEKYFPFTSDEGKQFLNELISRINSTTVDRDSLVELIRKSDRHDSKIYKTTPQEWLACMGSSATHRGYPCGLWKLFHYLTVNANNESDPTQVLNAMHGYIKNYFGCSDCSQHFQEMANRRNISSVTTLDSSIIWLWEAHNEVNKRLAGDEAEDPVFPKIQFPSKMNCPMCQKDSDGGSWDYEEVLKYMKKLYGRDNIKTYETVLATSGSRSFDLTTAILIVPVVLGFINSVIF